MGEQEGLSTIAIRLGAFQSYSVLNDQPKFSMLINSWLSQPDAMQLFEKCIDAPFHLKFAIVHGVSRNTLNRMDIHSTCQLLGYHPKDNFFEAQQDFKSLNITSRLCAHNLQ